MQSFIVLGELTPQGHKASRTSAFHADTLRRCARECAAEVEFFYVTLGESDIVAGVRALDAHVMARLSLSLASTGFMRTRTLPALPEAAARRMLAS